jgi:hypothetical protein
LKEDDEDDDDDDDDDDDKQDNTHTKYVKVTHNGEVGPVRLFHLQNCLKVIDDRSYMGLNYVSSGQFNFGLHPADVITILHEFHIKLYRFLKKVHYTKTK